MKISVEDLNKNIVLGNGQEITTTIRKDKKTSEVPLTVGLAIYQALLGLYPDEQATMQRPGLDGYTKYLRNELAYRIKNAAKLVTITDEEEEQILTTLEKGWASPEVYSFICVTLKIKPKKPEAEKK